MFRLNLLRADALIISVVGAPAARGPAGKPRGPFAFLSFGLPPDQQAPTWRSLILPMLGHVAQH